MTEREHLAMMHRICPRCGRLIVLHSRSERLGCAVGWWPEGQAGFPARGGRPTTTADDLARVVDMMAMDQDSRAALKRQLRAGDPGARFVVYAWAVRHKVPGFTANDEPRETIH